MADRAGRRYAYTLLATCAACIPAAAAAEAAAPAASDQPGQTTQAQERRIVIESGATAPSGAPNRINTTGRTIQLTVPAKDGGVYLGDILVSIDANDRIEFSAQRLLDLLSNVVDPAVLTTLRGSFAGSATLTPASFEASGIRIRYDPQQLALVLDIAAERRASRSVQVSPLDRSRIGEFDRPAGFSAYLNVRGNLDYLWDGANDGLQSPIMYMDGAVRVGGIVVESESAWQPGSSGVDYQRLGTRAVYDDQRHLMRWTAGDLQPVTRALQSSPDIAGISVFRSYSVLQPQEIVRPRGDRSFQLQRASQVEIQVNGQIVRRLQLQPGTYNLRDFPYTQGSNDIRLSILDDTGRTETLRFNVFLDQSQLAKGLTEFGFYAGVLAPLGPHGPDYSDDFAMTGFIRHGISDFLTLGVNLQGDSNSQMGGAEAVWATGFGTFGGNFSISHIDHFGSGTAVQLTFQRLIQRSGGRADSLNLFFESRSRRFGARSTSMPSSFATTWRRAWRALRCPTSGTNSHAVSSPSTSPAPGTSANSGVAFPPIDSRTGPRRRCPGPTGLAYRPPAGRAWSSSPARAARNRPGS